MVVALRDVTKRFGSVLALDGVTLDVGEGEILGLLGPNGSGKSTLLKVVARLIPPDEGTVTLPADGRAMMLRTGMLFDHTVHWETLTGYENARFFARSYGMDPEAAHARLRVLFSLFGLRDRWDDPVSTYSYGMRRKLGLIEALAHEPSLVLLDEPSIGLDYRARGTLAGLLRAAARRGAAVVFSTNDVNKAAGLADRVALFDRGRLLVSGEPSALVRSLGAKVTIDLRLAAPVALRPLREVSGVEGVDAEGREDGFCVTVIAAPDGSGPSSLLARVVHAVAGEGGVVVGVDLRVPGLPDVVLAYTGGMADVP
ncbi:ABC transporter ATP-binding protein [Methanoculleus sp.]|jgi:ABC-2 type transport system ATP-binding protein|uniref:ABC transporter ATP-binding protein n=1 Tax=Methanoculleus sp. TaxID=90427 RepID=UPI0026149935|nr:ABC transporter ATP-binding protein [Methanoculleus sp.]MDI6867821.1 ABC transporter ATP-binding protein [Methanoculleus sp.]MDN5340097.1 type transport system ATP-binding protein [Euryarchaeota archaeon]